jgi:hypothetical protein
LNMLTLENLPHSCAVARREEERRIGSRERFVLGRLG